MGICLAELCMAILSPCTAIGFLQAVCGYDKREKRTPFFLAASLFAAASFLSALLIRDAETQSLCSELLLLTETALLPYLLLVPKRRTTFARVALMLCSTADLLQCVLLSFAEAPTRLQEKLVYCAIYAVFAAACWAPGMLHIPPSVPDFPDRVPGLVYFVLFVSNYSAYYSMTLRRNAQSYTVVASALHYLSVILSVACIGYMVYRYTLLNKRRKEEEARHALELQRYAEMIRNDTDVRAFRHDYKNNLFALQSLLDVGKTEEAQQYIDTLSDSLDRTRPRYRTGNLLADAILTDKADKAQTCGIDVQFDGVIGCGIADSDLCTILANALDNAIEGCRDMTPCTIRVRSETKPAGMILTVQNPVAEKVEIRGGSVQTKKKDARNHGFGIANIRRAAKRYDGYADIACDEQYFTIEIGLIFNKEAET